MEPGKSSIDYSELWERLRDELNHYNKKIGIEYMDYKKRDIYNFETEQQNYEMEFYHFPCEELTVNNGIQIFHEFYENEIGGVTGPVNLGDENQARLQKQIASNSEKDRCRYIYDKLLEKFCNIENNVQRALIGPKQHFQLSDDHPEAPILVNLQNLYSRMLASDESQLKIFENIDLTKTSTDIYTEILIAFIEERIKILTPKLKHYRKQAKEKFKLEVVEMSKEIPLIKLNYNPDQQTEIIQYLYDNLVPELIEVSYLKFERHFITKRSKINMIVWKGKEVEIAHLFLSLRNKNIIIAEHQNKLIEYHFYNKHGKSFNKEQLSVLLYKTQIKNYSRINSIIKNLEKLVLTFN